MYQELIVLLSYGTAIREGLVVVVALFGDGAVGCYQRTC
jgi:hypothetical protein